MNASTVSRQINSLRPSLKGQYSVKRFANKVIVIVSDSKIQLELEEAASNFGYMCLDHAFGFQVC